MMFSKFELNHKKKNNELTKNITILQRKNNLIDIS